MIIGFRFKHYDFRVPQFIISDIDFEFNIFYFDIFFYLCLEIYVLRLRTIVTCDFMI